MESLVHPNREELARFFEEQADQARAHARAATSPSLRDAGYVVVQLLLGTAAAMRTEDPVKFVGPEGLPMTSYADGRIEWGHND